MNSNYNSEIIKIAEIIIKKSKDYHNRGQLIEAANMIRKAKEFFLPELEESSDNEAAVELKALYDKTSSKITNSMIKVLPKQSNINLK